MSAAASRDVFAVVEAPAAADAPPKPRRRSRPHSVPLLGNAEDRSHGLRYRGGIADGGKFDDPHSVREAARRAGGQFQCEPSLADPADTGRGSPTDAPSALFEVG